MSAEKVTWLNRRLVAIFAALLVLSTGLQVPALASGTDNPVISESLSLTVYLDGFVLIEHELGVNQSYPTVNVTLLGGARENMLVLDGHGLPLDYSTTGNYAIVNSLGADAVKISYITQELTSKMGQAWTLTTETWLNTTIILPKSATVLSLSAVPEQIESSNGQVTLIMPPGRIEITYAAEHTNLPEQTNTSGTSWQLILIAAASLLIPSFAVAIWISRRRKPGETAVSAQTAQTTVDIEKLLAREKDLRPDELKVVHFLAEKNGTAFEAELYDKLGLPRTSTWRLLKRLEGMEIVDIRKSRRQNIVSIRKKYLKTEKEA